MDTHVTDIVEKNFRSGVGKNGKPWALHKYKANNGTEFSSFDDLEIGDVVKLEQNEKGYWNGSKPRKQDNQHDEVMEALRKLYAKVDALEKTLRGDNKKRMVDTIVDVPDGDVSLDDIPLN